MSTWAIKPLLLPSNGLFYSSILSIKEPDIFLVNQIQSSFYSSSETEFLYFLISRYTDFKDPKNMLYNDAFFIWMYMFSILNNNEFLMSKSTCKFCENQNVIKADLSSMSLTLLNSDANKTLEYSLHDFIFTYQYRTLEHNIKTGNLEIEIENKKDILEMLYAYFFPQCINIYNKNTKKNYNASFLKEALNMIGYKNLLNFFEIIRNEKWGLNSIFYYKCTKCYKNIDISIGDSFSYSIYNIDKKTSSKIKDLIYLASLKILNFEEILSIPISEYEQIVSTITEIQKQKSGVKNFLDEASNM